MLDRSWLPRFSSRLRPISRQERKRARRGKQRRGFEQLELRALLTTVTDTEDFNVVNHNQFGAGQAFTSSNSYFLGANFDTGQQSIGGFVYPLGIKSGLQASFDLNGTAGLNLGYFVNSGSVSAGYNGDLTQDFADPTAIGNVPINTNVSLSNGTLSTQSPTFGANADAVLKLGGNVGIDAAAFGSESSFNKSFDTGTIDQSLFSINQNNDQSIDVLGQPATFSHTFGVEVDEIPPISIDTNVSTTNNPLGAKESLSVALEQNDGENTGADSRDSEGSDTNENGGGNGASVSFNLGTASQTIPDVQLNANQSDSSGDLSANTTDGPSTQLADMQLQMGPLAAALLDLPPIFTTMEFSAGPATVDVTPLSFTMGPTLYANQSVSATPTSTITYVFDHPVMVQLNNAPYQLMNQVTFTPGEELAVQFDGTPIQVTPYWNFQIQFHNQINLDVDLTSTLTVGEIDATLNLPSYIQSALGLPVTLGPLYQHNFDLANFPAITAFNQTFDILDQTEQMQPFTIGDNFNPSLTVTRNDDPNATADTLRAAVNSANILAAQNGADEGPDVIVLGPGTYTLSDPNTSSAPDNGTAGELYVTDPNLTIIGAGAGQTIIQAAPGFDDRIFGVAPGGGLHLQGVTITGGDATINTYDPNSGPGGGIYNDGGTLTLDNVDVTGNTANAGGGGIAITGGNTTLTNTTVSNNSAISNPNFASSGGGLNVVDGFINGKNAPAYITIQDSTFSGNTASDRGGAIASVATLCVMASSFNDNSAAGGGGAILNEGSATVVGSTFTGNSTPNGGGGILDESGATTATDDSFTQNSASFGGAITNVSVDNSLTATGSTFNGNIASGFGGAVYNDFASNNTMSFTNCTLVGNQGAVGGALYDASTNPVSFASSTIVQNSAGSKFQDAGGGLFLVSSSTPVTLQNTIVAENTSGTGVDPDILGTVTSLGHNLIGIASADTGGVTNGVNGDLVGSPAMPLNPELGALQNNGGTTLTVGLLANSPAIDAGDDNGAPATDQRGFARPSGPHVDIGAVEYIHSPLTVTNFTDDNVQTSMTMSGSGPCTLTVNQNPTLRDAINMFNGQGGSNTIDLLAGTYTLTDAEAHDLAVSGENLTIVGAGAGQTIIDASALGDRAFDVGYLASLHLVGVTITGGDSANDGQGNGTYDTFGGAIRADGTVVLDNDVIENSNAGGGEGGGIYTAQGVILELNNTTVSGNSAGYGGGIYAVGFTSIVNSTVSNNTAKAEGGGLDLFTAQAIITDSTISDNSTGGDGGGFQSDGGVTVSGSTITGNTAVDGGGFYNSSAAAINGTTLSDNEAQLGGGAFNIGNSLTITASTFDGNFAVGGTGQNGTGVESGGGGGGGAGAGGAIFNQSGLTMTNSTLVNNQAIGGAGGQIAANATSPFVGTGGGGGGPQGGAGGGTGNGGAGQFASGGGGGGPVDPPGNGGAGGFGGGGGGGGGVSILGVFGSTSTGAGGAGGIGGGAGGSDQNDVGGGGGGGAGIGGAVFNIAGKASFLNDTIVDNAASGGPGGAGLDGGASGAAGAGVGGGVFVFAGSVTSENTVLATNTATQDPDVSGTFTSLGNNFVGNVGSAGGFVNQVSSDQVGGAGHPNPSNPTQTVYDPVIDPKLGPLQNNGGTTLTEVPTENSPLIDAGNNAAVASLPTDQRGGARIIGGTVDIGAVENQQLFVTTTQDVLGQRSLRQAVLDANTLGGNQTITLGAGTYTLTLAGAGETAGDTGDLNVNTVNLTIVGAGGGQTTIDASALGDRAFDVASGASLELSGLTVVGGSTTGDGGDILNQGTLTIDQSEIEGGTAGRGGAIANEATNGPANLSIDSSTLDGNTATLGGALNNYGNVAIVNSTIAGNSASQGGGIDSTGGQTSLLNVTVADNSATTSAGGISTLGGSTTFSLENTIVAGNTSADGSDLAGAFVSQGNNLIGNVGAATGFAAGTDGDLVGGAGNPTINPELGPLQNNGGPTPTLLPAANSPAVDSGNNNGAPSVDQRGIVRPLGGTVDIGSVEAVFLTVTRFDDGNLPGQLRRAVRDANSLGGTHTIVLPAGVYTLTAAGALAGAATGAIDISSNVTIVGAGADQTIINAAALGDRAFDVESGAMLTLTGVTIEGGSTSGAGGAVLNDHGTLVISHSELKDNAAAQGGAVANETSPGIIGSYAVSTLANSTNGIDAVTGTLAVANASQFPTTLPFTIQLDQEQMTVTDVAGDTFFVTRGVNGTTAAPHTFGASVSLVGGTASTTLSAIESNITVAALNTFPTTPGFFIQVGSEEMQVIAISPQDNSFTVTRGVNGTSVAPHLAGATVGLVSLSIDSSTLDGNTATGGGGGVYNLGGMTITNSTIYGNMAVAGGGVFNDGLVSLGQPKGGPTNYFGGLATLTNDTIAGNQASGAGGGIVSVPTGPVLLLHNTIVATDTAAGGNADLDGAFGSLGHNLIGDVGTATGFTAGANGDQVGGNGNAVIDPLLSPLRDNGGPLPTLALITGSPAIDTGDDVGAPPTDERSIIRNQGPHVDIGAYELTYDLEIDLPGGGTQSLFTDLGQGLTQMSSPNGKFQTFTFENPSHSLTIVSEAGGNDVITLGQLESGFTVDIKGDGQGDKIHLLAGAVLNPPGGETILDGDTLAGVGTVASPLVLQGGANLAPDSADPLTVTANLTLNPGANFVETLAGTTAGSGYDQVVVTGTGSTITLNGATLDATLLAPFVPAAGEQFTIISNQTGNPIAGTFAGLPEGQVFDIGGTGFWITYHGGASGNDVVLNVASPPTATPVSITATEGITFNGTVATFTDTTPNVTSGSYTATIIWGDGQSSGGTVSGTQATGFTVTGSHAYAEEGNYQASIVIGDFVGTVTTTDSVQVADAPLSATSVAIASTEGATFTGAVAAFGDADPNGVASDYTAMVVWGDGQTSAGTVSGSEAADFTVTGSHVYVEEGEYAATVTIDDHGSAATATDSVQVADAPLTATAVNVASTEGAAFHGTVATFTDANPDGAATEYTATITWGDGHTSVGTISGTEAGGFTVSGANTYAEEGSYSLNVVINDVGGSLATAIGTAQVADAPLSASGVTINALYGTALSQAVVATFVDLGGPEPVADYSASVNWGDGATSTGLVVANGNGTFSVEGSHTYAAIGNYAVTVSINHENGITATAQSTAVVTYSTGLLVLDPTGLAALNDIGNGTIDVQSAGIQVDSNNRAALTAVGDGTISASQILVTGKPGVFTLGHVTINGTVTAGVPALADPLANLTPPTPSTKPLSAVYASGSQKLTLNPGTYAGGIHVDGQAVVTLNPGTYYLEGGGLTVSDSGKLIGNGVTIYNSGLSSKSFPNFVCDPIVISDQATVQLTAPTSGPLAGVALFQDRTSVLPMLVSDNATVEITGVTYAAKSPLIITGDARFYALGNAPQGLTASVIFDDVSVSGDATLDINVTPPSGNGSGNMPGGPSNPTSGNSAQALECFFQGLTGSSGINELNLWSTGIDNDGPEGLFGGH